jgi:hypothetical protein
VSSLIAMFRRMWALGPAGVRVPLTLGRNDDVLRVEVLSIDRNAILKKPRLH